jgi:hypothetical protein
VGWGLIVNQRARKKGVVDFEEGRVAGEALWGYGRANSATKHGGLMLWSVSAWAFWLVLYSVFRLRLIGIGSSRVFGWGLGNVFGVLGMLSVGRQGCVLIFGRAVHGGVFRLGLAGRGRVFGKGLNNVFGVLRLLSVGRLGCVLVFVRAVDDVCYRMGGGGCVDRCGKEMKVEGGERIFVDGI